MSYRWVNRKWLTFKLEGHRWVIDSRGCGDSRVGVIAGTASWVLIRLCTPLTPIIPLAPLTPLTQPLLSPYSTLTQTYSRYSIMPFIHYSRYSLSLLAPLGFVMKAYFRCLGTLWTNSSLGAQLQ